MTVTGEFDGWDVSEGGYGDIIEWADRNDKDNDGYITLVQVVKADDGTAELVYILKYIPTTVYDVLFYGNHDAFTWSGAEQYEEGSDYTGTITAAEGYDISNVTVTKGAEYVTPDQGGREHLERGHRRHRRRCVHPGGCGAGGRDIHPDPERS